MRNNILYIILFFAMASSAIGWEFYFSKSQGYYYYDMPKEKADKEIEKSWERYHMLSGEEIFDIWNDLFFGSKYILGGRGVGQGWDCSSSYSHFFRYLGANLVNGTAYEMGEELRIFGQKRRKSKDVRKGDIIVFKRNGNGIGHIGVIYKTDKTLRRSIFYVEVSQRSNGVGYKQINFKNNRIKGIFYMSQTVWKGDV